MLESEKIYNAYNAIFYFYQSLIQEWKTTRRICWENAQSYKKELMQHQYNQSDILESLINKMFLYTKLCTEGCPVCYDFWAACLDTYKIIMPYLGASFTEDEIMQQCDIIFPQLNQMVQRLNKNNSKQAIELYNGICVIAVNAWEICTSKTVVNQKGV